MMAFFQGSALVWASIFAVVFLYQVTFRNQTIRRNGAPLRKPPDTLPVVGNGILFLQARQKLFSWFVKCERQFGHETFQITVPTLHPGVVINDPKNLEYVFKNEGLFVKGDFVKSRSWDLFGHGIINADGDLWKAQRKAGLNFLNTSNLRILTDVALPRYLNQSIDGLRKHAVDGSVVDLQTVYHEITSQLMGKMAYGMEMHATDDFTKAFEYASGVTTERFQNPLWFMTEYVTGFRFRGSLAIIRSFGRSIVDSAVQQRRKVAESDLDPAPSDDRLNQVSGSLINSLLDTLGARHDLVAEAALNYLSAGRDTVAQALTWTTHLLMQHRFALGKARNEVLNLRRLTQDLAPEGEQKPISSADFTPTALPYIMAVFYEALRLFPPIPFEIKECDQATTLPDGTFLPRKSIVVWCPWAMNRSRTTWGPDADTFRPERWLGEDGRPVARSASEFPVFNGGPRTCLGKRMAELLAVQVIAAMVSTFDFVPAYETERVSRSSLTLPMEGGLPCFVRMRTTGIA
ncbi:cytochrome P450 [Xylariomycetidae sp. FL2044]|nr:cytochrome P450 [Xylariomycetidae sp. FL2044]